MEERNPEEMRFAKLAEKLGESLETVWNMAETERSQLLDLLLIDEETGEVNGNIDIPLNAHCLEEGIIMSLGTSLGRAYSD